MTRLLTTVCAALLCGLIAAPGVHAQEATVAAQPDALPVEISADNGLEWDRVAHTYTAKGRAEVKQGEMRVTSDILVARYDPAGGGSDIREVTAEGDVILSSAPYTAYGDRAVYDLASGVAILTGGALRVRTPRETLTARDRLTYRTQDGRMTAEGNVTIVTAREKISADRGVYDAQRQQAEMTGDVVITQGKNRLEGRRATIDLKTGVSQLYGSSTAAGGTGRVKGVFYPKSKAAVAAAVTPAPVLPAPVPTSPAPVASPVSVVTEQVKEAPLPPELFALPTPAAAQPDTAP